MSWLSSNIFLGLPALVGVVLGLKTYVEGYHVVYQIAAVMVAAALVLYLGYNIMPRWPRLARWLIEMWIASAVCVTALATAFVTWISASGPLNYIIDTRQLSTDQTKTMTTALISAVVTYVALVWTKDIGDAKGYFWPSTHFKKAIQQAFNKLSAKPAPETPAYQAIFGDFIEGEGVVGWDFEGRGVRARRLAQFLS